MATLDSLYGVGGRRVLLTGAAGGIGRATARLLADLGARLALTDVDEGGLAETVAALGPAGATVSALAFDLRDDQVIQAGVATAAERLGGLDALINNAAIRSLGPALELPVADWDALMDVNLRATFLASQAAARLMARAGGGRIVNLASQLGFVAAPNRVAYTTSKGAIIQLTRTLAYEWAALGITVNALAPGPTETPMLAYLDKLPGERERLLAGVPLGRFGRPEEMAAAIAFLLSPAAAYITGHTLVADGGYTIH